MTPDHLAMDRAFDAMKQFAVGNEAPVYELGPVKLIARTESACDIAGMEITRAQFEQVESCLPRQRGNVSLSNLQVLNAILYVAEHGCKWRGLPKRFGNWHTIYTRMSRWARSGVLDRAFGQLQRAQVVQIKIEAVSLDSTSIKVHPDGTGARKKTVRRLSASPVTVGTPRSTSSRRMPARP
jgi:transposase